MGISMKETILANKTFIISNRPLNLASLVDFGIDEMGVLNPHLTLDALSRLAQCSLASTERYLRSTRHLKINHGLWMTPTAINYGVSTYVGSRGITRDQIVTAINRGGETLRKQPKRIVRVGSRFE